ncbi:hypothetical protein SAMN05421747_11865 [Parapedobacter composti]|uniref:Uncharacterized protein n=1 Tax=Parapedobacter composti TaxID=623281 RepID=A0A1I1LAV3_9SPHI|nr:hypothetical protein [Parapedobacter composti]SFC67513.1 hypothetical protein SAMN05421747_11865 [Parapedobacter composti]
MKLQELNEQELRETNGGLLNLNITTGDKTVDVDGQLNLGAVDNLLGGLLGGLNLGGLNGLVGRLLGTVSGLLGGLLGRL